jgi:hypothetical protein
MSKKFDHWLVIGLKNKGVGVFDVSKVIKKSVLFICLYDILIG